MSKIEEWKIMTESKTTLQAEWNGGIGGEGKLKSGYLDTKIAVPTELKGSGNGTDPKELLASAAATCYMATLASILENRKIPVAEHRLYTEATLLVEESTITLFPEIVLSEDVTEAQIQSAKRALEAADRVCNVGKLLKKAGVVIELVGKVSVR